MNFDSTTPAIAISVSEPHYSSFRFVVGTAAQKNQKKETPTTVLRADSSGNVMNSALGQLETENSARCEWERNGNAQKQQPRLKFVYQRVIEEGELSWSRTAPAHV